MTSFEQLITLWNQLSTADKYTFQKNLQIFDGRNIILGTSTGTSIGTNAAQKLSIHGVTPVVQANAISAPNSQGSTYSQADVNSIVAAVNSLRTAVKNFGITA